MVIFEPIVSGHAYCLDVSDALFFKSLKTFPFDLFSFFSFSVFCFLALVSSAFCHRSCYGYGNLCFDQLPGRWTGLVGCSGFQLMI